MTKLILLGYLLCSVGYIFSGSLGDCPTKCQCGILKGQLTWSCEGNNITTDELKDFVNYGDPKTVIHLKLRKNDITTFPLQQFVNFTKLEILDIGENHISSFPKNIAAYLPSLNQIMLNQNNLASISSIDLVGYENIKQLDAFQNKIKELPANAFSNLLSLEKLFLEKNEISKVSVDALNGLKKLSKFSLEGNRLTEIPVGFFKDTTQLTRLWLSKNPLTSIHANLFQNLTNLYELNLVNASLTDDKIETNAFSGLTLEELNLISNSLTTLKQEWFNKFTGPFATTLNGNPVNCDCHLYDTFKAWIKNDPQTVITGNCKTPSAVAGQRIANVLSDNKLGCTSCSTHQCQNNATCNVIDADSYECKCSVFYYGKFCELDELCIDTPCLNNATCQNHNASHFTCNCTEGYTGDICEKEKPCFSGNPCINNGTCVVTGLNYFCNCIEGYGGKNCEKLISNKGTMNKLRPGWIVLILLAVLAQIVIIGVIVYKKQKMKFTSSYSRFFDDECSLLKGNNFHFKRMNNGLYSNKCYTVNQHFYDSEFHIDTQTHLCEQ